MGNGGVLDGQRVSVPVDRLDGESVPAVLALDVFKERFGSGFILKYLWIMSRHRTIWKLEMCSCFGRHKDK